MNLGNLIKSKYLTALSFAVLITVIATCMTMQVINEYWSDNNADNILRWEHRIHIKTANACRSIFRMKLQNYIKINLIS